MSERNKIPASMVLMYVSSLLFILLLAGVMFFFFFMKKESDVTEPYSAVFLSNGQVYFGQMERHGDEVWLSNVYYISGGDKATPNKEGAGLQLIHLGNEVHGPTDELRINYDQVLFTETLRDDSEVVQAIKTTTP